LGCNQNELDFIVRQQDNKMSICIFDTAKGGAGYSKRLATKYSISQMFDSIRGKLNECETIDKILDRTTMQYANRINVKATKEWLAKEYECRKVVPQEIQNRFDNEVQVSYYEEIRRAIATSIFIFNENNHLQLTISQGVSEKKRSDINTEVVLQRAEVALKKACKFTRNITVKA
jgi:hypothetical protein